MILKLTNWLKNGWHIAIDSNYTRFGKTIKVDDGLGLLLYDCRDGSKRSFTNRTNLMIIDANIGLIDYITDTHSIKLTNNNRTIQVPTPIALNCIEGVSDYIYKDSDGVWKLVQKCQKYEFTGKEDFAIQSINKFGIVNFITNNLKYKIFSSCICSHFVHRCETIVNTKNEGVYPIETSSLYFRIDQNRFSTVDALKTYLAEQYQSNAPITLVYYHNAPVEYILSEYAQNLLNSFELANNNYITVEGNPKFNVSGYLKK